MRKYSKAIKEQALEMAAELGLKKTTEIMNLPKPTLVRWRQEERKVAAQQKDSEINQPAEEIEGHDASMLENTENVEIGVDNSGADESLTSESENKPEETEKGFDINFLLEDDDLTLQLRLQKTEIENLQKENERLRNAIAALIDRQRV